MGKMVIPHKQKTKIMKTKALLFLNLFFTGSIVSGVGQPPAPPPDFPGNEYKKLYEETVILVDQATQILADLNQSIELSGIEFSKREKELLQIRLVKKEKESKLAEYEANLTLKNEDESVLSQNLNDLISGTQKMEEEIKLLNLQIEEFPRKLESLNQELVTVEKEIVESTRKLKVPHLPSWHYVDGKGWLWTSPSHFPYVYSSDRENWVFYDQGTHSPWLFYDYQSETWQKWFQ
jgi:hypothetical protein